MAKRSGSGRKAVDQGDGPKGVPIVAGPKPKGVPVRPGLRRLPPMAKAPTALPSLGRGY